jgi:hypothetical protein
VHAHGDDVENLKQFPDTYLYSKGVALDPNVGNLFAQQFEQVHI